ncbi:MAG TPA: TetR/AcrR family transcriptional regulator [Acidimicrobiales bacterium]
MPKVIGGSIDAHRRLIRQRIFDAFAGLLRQRGYDAITLADVAAKAGMSRTTMYNYFPDKDALVVAFADEEAARHVSELRQRLGEIENPVDRLRAFIAEQLRFVSSHQLPPGRALKVALSGTAYARVLEHVGAVEQLLRDLLHEGVDQGYFPIDDVEATIPLVSACLDRGGPDDERESDLDDTIEVTDTFVLRALGVRLGPNGRPRRQARAAR